MKNSKRNDFNAIVVVATEVGPGIEVFVLAVKGVAALSEYISEGQSINSYAWELDENIYNMVLVCPTYFDRAVVMRLAARQINDWIKVNRVSLAPFMVADETIDYLVSDDELFGDNNE